MGQFSIVVDINIHVFLKYNPRTEIYIQIYNKEAWHKIFNEGKKYILEKSPEERKNTKNRFYFDS